MKKKLTETSREEQFALLLKNIKLQEKQQDKSVRDDWLEDVAGQIEALFSMEMLLQSSMISFFAAYGLACLKEELAKQDAREEQAVNN